jgi:hypothetical protein
MVCADCFGTGLANDGCYCHCETGHDLYLESQDAMALDFNREFDLAREQADLELDRHSDAIVRGCESFDEAPF